MQVEQQGWVMFVEAVVPPAHLVWVGVTTQAPGEYNFSIYIIYVYSCIQAHVQHVHVQCDSHVFKLGFSAASTCTCIKRNYNKQTLNH